MGTPRSKSRSRPNHDPARRARTPYLIGFDTEDDGRGNPFLFTCVHERGSFHARTRGEFVERLDRLAQELREEGRSVEAWATNLEYDLVNVFGVDRIGEVSLRFGRTYLVGATWRGILFRDTFRHLPISVKIMGELVGLKKLTRSRSLRYAMRDAQITYRGARYLHDTYRSLGIRPRNTLAASAMALFQEQHFEEPMRLPDPYVLSAARETYHGGRTEPFSISPSSLPFDRVHVIDASSMFPWAMIVLPFPVAWGSYRRVGRGGRLSRLGLYRVRVHIKRAPGPLPYRTDSGTIYPLGSWEGWYTGEECLYVRLRGDTVSVLEGIEFLEEVDPFQSYIASLFSLKNESRGPERLLYKILLNALYGKFGERGGRIVIQTLDQYESRPHPTARIWNGLAIYRVETEPRPHANVVWASLVTARARVRLHQEIERVLDAGGRPLYCDTDSVFFTISNGAGSKLHYPSKAARPGDFELKGVYRHAHIVGKKEYALETSPGVWSYHAKGVPTEARETFFKTGKTTFQRPNRLLESTVRSLKPNVWSERTKVRRIDYRGRRRNADGSLSPLVVRG